VKHKKSLIAASLVSAGVGFALMFLYNAQTDFYMGLSCVVTFSWGVQDAMVAMHLHLVLFNEFQGPAQVPSQVLYMCIKSIALGSWVVLAGVTVNTKQQWNHFFIAGFVVCIFSWCVFIVFH
jgi:hypothetical protein